MKESTKKLINEQIKKVLAELEQVEDVADRVELRHIPELEFIYDESIEYGKRIEEKIKEIL